MKIITHPKAIKIIFQLDDKGMFDIKSAHEMAEKNVEPDKIENAKKLFDMCSSGMLFYSSKYILEI